MRKWSNAWDVITLTQSGKQYLVILPIIAQKKNLQRFGLFLLQSFFIFSTLKQLKSYFLHIFMIMADVRNIQILEMGMVLFCPPFFGNEFRPWFSSTILPTQIPDQRLKLNKGMMMFGRLIGIWISQKISPAMYASVDMIICTVVISLMAIPTLAGNELTYAVTAIYGLAMSTVYGSGVSLTASYMNVSGT